MVSDQLVVVARRAVLHGFGNYEELALEHLPPASERDKAMSVSRFWSADVILSYNHRAERPGQWLT